MGSEGPAALLDYRSSIDDQGGIAAWETDIEEQLQAFKSGNRHNDISEQMRSVARRLTGEEIAMLATYYSSFVK